MKLCEQLASQQLIFEACYYEHEFLHRRLQIGVSSHSLFRKLRVEYERTGNILTGSVHRTECLSRWGIRLVTTCNAGLNSETVNLLETEKIQAR